MLCFPYFFKQNYEMEIKVYEEMDFFLSSLQNGVKISIIG